MKVIATRRGYYGGNLLEAGSEFTIAGGSELGSWMKLAEGEQLETPATKKARQTAAKKNAAEVVAEAVAEVEAPEAVAEETAEVVEDVM